MRDEKALELFNGILQKTRSGELPWERTPEKDIFVASLGKGLVLKIWPYSVYDIPGGPEGPPSVGLVDENNDILVDMTPSIEGISKDELEEVHSLAKRRALKIDERIDAALSRLENLKS